jgi:DNA-binding MarR family transcriptional regulator
MMGGMPDSAGHADLLLPAPLLQFPSFLLFQLARQARRIGGAVHQDDLRMPHVTVLATIDEFGPAAQKDISRRLRIDASDLVSLLDDLEERGLVRRQRDERDRRRYLVTITESGTRVLRDRLATMGRLNDILLSVLTPTERERFTEMLVRIYRRHEPDRVPVDLLVRQDTLSRAENR